MALGSQEGFYTIGNGNENHRFKKYLKGRISKGSSAQLLAAHRTTQNSNPISERFVTREQSSVLPLCTSSEEAVGHQDALLNLLFSKLSKPRDFSCSACVLPSRPFTTFLVLLWMLSNSCISLYCAPKQHPVQEARPHSIESRGQPLPLPGGGAEPGAPHGAVVPLGCQGALLALTQFTVD